MENQMLRFIVKYQKQTIPVEFSAQDTVLQLKEYIQSVLGIDPSHQKLLLKAVLSDHLTLTQAGLLEGSKLLLVASKEEEVQQVAAATVKPTTPAPVISASHESQKQRQRQAALEPSRIGHLEVLDLPEKDFAMRLLEKLRDDLGIKEILRKHNWHIGVLKELTPLEQKIAGYNKNKGMEIAVKLRNLWDQTWRSWPEIMETMLHELAHCDHSEHDANFHRLNRQLNKEVKELDWTKGKGGKVGGDLEAYNPEPKFIEDSLADVDSLDWRVATKRSSGQRLGGNSVNVAIVQQLAPAQMAGLMAEIRLSKREQELVDTCGCGKASEADMDAEHSTTLPSGLEHQGCASGVNPHLHVDVCPTPDGTALPTSSGDVTETMHADGLSSSDPPSPSIRTTGTAGSNLSTDVAVHQVPEDPVDMETDIPASVAHSLLPCPICGISFEAGATERYISNHIEQCLAKGACTGDLQQAHTDSPADVAAEAPAAEDEPRCCPLCGTGFPQDATERFMVNHIERCLIAS